MEAEQADALVHQVVSEAEPLRVLPGQQHQSEGENTVVSLRLAILECWFVSPGQHPTLGSVSQICGAV